MQVRAGRATMNPVKDKEKAAIIQPFVGALRQHMVKPPASEKGRAALVEARWMLEELKVSVFAQELGTPQPVSPKRLQGQLEEIAKAGE
jgi:ATP-dependent helicase HrpA